MMIKSLIISVLLSASLFNFAPAEPADDEWVDLGEQRITCYCPVCNDGEGHESSSGKELEYGDCACSWLPEGTKVSIEGEIFTNVDKCGTEAIDIFIDTDDSVCHCNLNEYRKVSVKYD